MSSDIDTLDTVSVITTSQTNNSHSHYLPSLASSDSLSASSFLSDINNSTTSINPNNTNNNSNTTVYSPLGPNSIYELVLSTDFKRKNKIAVQVNNKTTKIPLGPPSHNDIPPVKLSKLTKVDDAQFESYLSSIRSEFSIFQQNRSLTESSLKALDKDPPSSSNTNIDNVPAIFFDSNFRLDNPSVFYKVIEGNNILDTSKNNKQYLSESLLLQEKLSWYLDIIEIHLIDEISKSSSSFFNTFNELSRITETSKQSITLSKKLLANFDQLHANQVEKAYAVLRNLKKQLNLLKLQQSMLQINMVLKIADYAEIIFYQSNYLQSLNLINFSESLIKGDLSLFQETDNNSLSKTFLTNLPFINAILTKLDKFPHSLQNLSSIKSLIHLQQLFGQLKLKIGQSFNNLFIDYIIEDLRNFFDSLKIQASFKRLLNYTTIDNHIIRQILPTNTNTIDYNFFAPQFKTLIKQYIYGLVKCNEIFNTFQRLEEKLIVEFKNIIKNHLPNEENFSNLESFSKTSSHVPTAAMSQVSLNSKTNTFQANRFLLPAGGGSLDDRSETASNTSSSRFSSKTSNANQKLVNYLRAMTPKEFEVMLINIYCNVAECLRRLSAHQKFLLDISLDIIQYLPDDSTQNNEEDIVLKLDLSPTITKLIETLQKRIFKILNIRNDLIGQFNYKFFIRFYLINRCFLIDNENLSNGLTNNYFLSKFLSKQIHDFYTIYTTSLKNHTIEVIEKDVWKDLGNAVNGQALRQNGQTLIDELLQFANSEKHELPPSWLEIIDFNDYTTEDLLTNDGKPLLSSTSAPVSSESTTTTPTSSSSSSSKKDLGRIKVNNQSIVVSPLIVTILQSIKELVLLHAILGKHVLTFPFVLIDLISLTNSKIRHQILGANATRTAGLKHITAKHLSISSQCLELLIQLMPSIQAAINHINKFNLNKPEFKRSVEVQNNDKNNNENDNITIDQEFTNITNLLKDHQNDIFTKLISIMNDRVTNHAISLSKIDFSQPLSSTNDNTNGTTNGAANANTTAKQQCHPYMETLVKETITISKVLTKYLNEGQYLLVLSEIFTAYKKVLLQEFQKFSPANGNSGGKQFNDNLEKMSLLKDIDYFRVKLGDLPGYGESGTVLWEYVNGLQTKEEG